MIQDAAYQSLLKSTRQHYHQQIAQVLEERFPETTETQPELLAHHYTEAGLIAQAIPYWQQAGQRAVQRSANAEAISHLTKGLELLQTLPDTPERAQQELMLQITLGAPLIATKGLGPRKWNKPTPGRGSCVSRWARLLSSSRCCRDCGYFILCGRATRRRTNWGSSSCSLAQSVQDSGAPGGGPHTLGSPCSGLGELASGPGALEQGIALYDPQQHRSHPFLYGHDPGVCCLSYAALALWLLGYPDQA